MNEKTVNIFEWCSFRFIKPLIVEIQCPKQYSLNNWQLHAFCYVLHINIFSCWSTPLLTVTNFRPLPSLKCNIDSLVTVTVHPAMIGVLPVRQVSTMTRSCFCWPSKLISKAIAAMPPRSRKRVNDIITAESPSLIIVLVAELSYFNDHINDQVAYASKLRAALIAESGPLFCHRLQVV